MAWMDGAGDHHGSGADADSGTDAHGARDGALMPGMATPEQMAELEAADGVEAERLYLGLMIAHHAAGADMAQAGADLAATDKVRALATKMASAQTAEITALQNLLEQR
jgi:uncharacterized protein (DUF305 family)